MPSISRPEAILLDLIRRKTLGDTAGTENPLSFPQNDLMAMTLRSMLIVIRMLAKYRLITDDCMEPTGELQSILAASRVLTDWPENFIALLSELGERLQTDIAGGVGKQFEGIYRALFRNETIKREHTDFLRAVFLDFAMNHWGRGYVDHKLMKEMGGAIPKRFLTQTEFAAKIGVRQITAARFLKESELSLRWVKCDKIKRILVDVNQSTIPRLSPGRIFRKREAARRLGISVSVLRALKDAGIYEVNHLLPTRPGFHELDVKAFNKKFVALVSSSVSPGDVGTKGVTLRSVLCGRHDSTDVKVKVVRALLSNSIAVVGNENGTIGGLLLENFACREFVEGARRGEAVVVSPTLGFQQDSRDSYGQFSDRHPNDPSKRDTDEAASPAKQPEPANPNLRRRPS
jgi:hypothetical protein